MGFYTTLAIGTSFRKLLLRSEWKFCRKPEKKYWGGPFICSGKPEGLVRYSYVYHKPVSPFSGEPVDMKNVRGHTVYTYYGKPYAYINDKGEYMCRSCLENKLGL